VSSQPCGLPDVKSRWVSCGDLAHWLAAAVTAANRLALLVFGQFRFAPSLMPALARPRINIITTFAELQKKNCTQLGFCSKRSSTLD
jgi:hypothetical protein